MFDYWVAGWLVLLVVLLLGRAAGLDLRAELVDPTVLGVDLNRRPLWRLAEIGAVLQQAFLAAFKLQDELGHRGVGHRSEGIANARNFRSLLTDMVDVADQI
jgi:hypothetical protein